MKILQLLIAICFALFATIAWAAAWAADDGGGGFFTAIAGFFEAFPVWLTAIMGVVTAATAITALTPTKVDNVVIDKLLKALNFLAGNFLMNKNKDDPG